MKLSLRMFGLEVFTFEASTEDAEEQGAPDFLSTPVGFTARYEQPDQANPADR